TKIYANSRLFCSSFVFISAPSNFKSLLLRAEVLRKMNHYQSSLADVDNALKSRYTSAKAHYLRSLALSDLGRYEEALYEICLAINLDKSSNLSSTELFQHDLTKILQKLLSQTPKCVKLDMVSSSLRSKCPGYDFPAREHRIKRRNINAQDEETLQAAICEEDDFLSANYGKECDILMTEDDVLSCRDFLNCADKRYTYASIARKYEMELKRQTSRKHFRRKWTPKETELLPIVDVESARCSEQFRNVLERLQQEFVRLKKIESSPEYAMKQLISVAPTLIDASDFDCVLCCRTFWKPVVTPCGHTYCLVCLDRCMDYTSSCPLCMSPLVEPSVNMVQGASSPVPLILTKRPVTKFLEAAMKRFIPDSYQKRFRQEMIMEPSVPIFICTTAFPSVPCPLFVYEPRYRLMVRRAVESGDKQFGIVQQHSGKARYHDYGCMLDIRDCVLLGDGCSILSTMGCKRFKILARNEKDGYETAKVEYIHDEAIPDEHLSYVKSMHNIVLNKAIAWYESLGQDLKHEILQSYGEMPVVEEDWSSREDGPAWAWWVIALLPLRPQLKVDILATTSLEKRLRAIEKTIHSMPGNYHYQRVSPNGNVAVVVHSQQHSHTNLNSPRHENDDEEDDDLDMSNEHVILDDENDNGDEEMEEEEDLDVDVEGTTIEHHIQNLDDNDENINNDDIDGELIQNHHHHHHDQQEHMSPNSMQQYSQRHHRQRHHNHHHHHHRHHHHQLHQNPLQPQEHFENVDNVDECCQRTTTSLVQHVLSNDQSQDNHHLHHTNANAEQLNNHHHSYENHRRQLNRKK
ncbi:LON peptidase N-terminal domain and RING finger protein 2-like, partial [Musca domestica]|uniref:LON peptidase N-terminal domain and RING finger protein 2-like n=1 Tax=Musca domestica TaxID=7370 RepID=A0ABM3VF92_MUSDO